MKEILIVLGAFLILAGCTPASSQNGATQVVSGETALTYGEAPITFVLDRTKDLGLAQHLESSESALHYELSLDLTKFVTGPYAEVINKNITDVWVERVEGAKPTGIEYLDAYPDMGAKAILEAEILAPTIGMKETATFVVQAIDSNGRVYEHRFTFTLEVK
jgi:hypothetical protein